MGMEICNLIRKEKAKDAYLERAAQHGWPAASIDFTLIPEHVLGMVSKLRQLTFDREYLEDSFIWMVFEGALKDDGLSIKQFSSLTDSKTDPSLQVVLQSMPG